MSVADLLVTAVVTAGGLPLAYAVVRRLPLALLCTPVVTALLATIAVMAMLVVGGDLRFWLAVVFIAQCAGSVLVFVRRRCEPLPRAGWWDAVWYTVPLLPPFLLTLGPPEQWDAHSIWWLHAAYLGVSDGLCKEILLS